MWNEEVCNRIKEDEIFIQKYSEAQNGFAGHVLRGSSGESTLEILEGNVEATRAQERPRQMWLDDTTEYM